MELAEDLVSFQDRKVSELEFSTQGAVDQKPGEKHARLSSLLESYDLDRERDSEVLMLQHCIIFDTSFVLKCSGILATGK